MKMRCTTGHIGFGGAIYATGDVFDVDDDVVAKSLIDGGDAEEVADVSTPSEPEPIIERDENTNKSKKPTRGAGKR